MVLCSISNNNNAIIKDGNYDMHIGHNCTCQTQKLSPNEDCLKANSFSAFPEKNYLFFSHAVTPFSVTTFLTKWSEEFFDVVNAKEKVMMLVRKNVIPQNVATAIEDATDEKAKEILYAHLKDYGNMDTLREYCMAADSANGYPKMQALARKMLKNLLQGWLCVYA